MSNGAPDGPRRLTLNPTLVLGLGGTGREVVSRLKSIVRNRLPGSAAENPVVRFLVLDTDAGEAARAALHESRPDGLSPSEFLPLPVEDVEGLFANRDKHPHLFSWFPDGVTARELKYGAAQCRPLGRLAFFWNAQAVRRAVETALKNAGNLRHRTVAQGLGYAVPEGTHIFLVSSICGGTGSGLLLDAAYLCRHLAQRAESVGMLVLPSAFEIEQQAAIEANGYATLRELEAATAARAFHARYGDDLEVRVEGMTPFDRTYLVDAWNERERHLETGGNVFRMAAEILFAKIFLGMYERHRSIVDNVQPKFARRIEGRLTAYSSLGHAALHVPVARLRETVARRKLSAYAAALAGGGAPPEDPVPFLREAGLDEETTDDLITALREVDGKPWRPVAQGGDAESLPVEEIPILAGNVERALRAGLKTCLDAMEGNGTRRIAQAETALSARLDRIATSGGGADGAAAFARAAEVRLRAFADLMDEEIESKFKKWKKNLFVAQKKERLTSLLSGFLAAWFRRGQILAALEEFSTELARDVGYDVEIASRRRAAECLRALAARAAEFARAFADLAARLRALAASAAEEARRLADPARAEGFITDLEILADPPALERFTARASSDPAELDGALLAASGGALASLAALPAEALEAALLPAIRRRVEASLDLSLPVVLAEPGVLPGLAPALVDAAAPFWEFSKVHLPSGFAPDEILVVSLEEPLRDAFRRACPDAARLVFSDPADPERVPAFRFKHGLPLFALKRVRREFRSAYETAVKSGRALHVFPPGDAPDLVP